MVEKTPAEIEIEKLEKEIKDNKTEIEELLEIATGNIEVSEIECPFCERDVDISDIVKQISRKAKLSGLKQGIELGRKESEDKLPIRMNDDRQIIKDLSQGLMDAITDKDKLLSSLQEKIEKVFPELSYCKNFKSIETEEDFLMWLNEYNKVRKEEIQKIFDNQQKTPREVPVTDRKPNVETQVEDNNHKKQLGFSTPNISAKGCGGKE